MKTFKFVYTACFGKCDYSDPMEGEIDIQDEAWDKIKAVHDEHPYDIAINLDEFEEIYLKCLEAILKWEGENLLDYDPEVIYNYLEDTREGFARDNYKLTLDDAIDYMDNCIAFSLKELFTEDYKGEE